MQSTALEPDSATQVDPIHLEPTGETPKPHLPDAGDLVDQVPPHFKASRIAAGCTLVLGLIYLTFCLKPIWHTDIWGHLAYGKVLWERGSLPSEEPLLPLAQGMPFIDTAWLSQLVSYGVWSQWGLAGLQGLTAIAVTMVCGIVLLRSYATTKSAAFSLLGLTMLLWFDWHQFIVVRPQLLALVCFSVLFARLIGRPRHSDWYAVPLLMLVWTNLHGSFPVGIALLGVFTVGRAIDVIRRTGKAAALWHDSRLSRLVLLTELAFAATLIHPYGLYLYREVWTFGSNPNLSSLTEWQPLEIRSWIGGTTLAILAALAILYRLTPRRIFAWEPLLVIGLSATAIWSSRMSAWLAPVAAYLMTVHAHAVWRAWRHAPFIPTPSPRAGLWTVVCLGLAWIFFGYSPLGLRLLHGRQPNLERAVTEYSPIGAVEYLQEFPPVGQVFNIYEWGDYLHWFGPAGMKIFVNSHAHAVPSEVWQSYLRVIHQESGWQDVLDRSGVNTVIVDRAVRDGLIRALKDDPKWRVGYEDHVATVFVRKQPI